MAGHRLIDAQLAVLAERLPADAVDELADGLIECWQHHRAAGLGDDQAAVAAVAEFGPADEIADEFVAQSPGRRAARFLLATGPILGAFWGASLIGTQVWTWPVPPPVGPAFAFILSMVVAVLLTAATSRHSYRRTRLGIAGARALVVLDATMIVGVVLLTPLFVWPMGIAVAASLARIGLALHLLPARS